MVMLVMGVLAMVFMAALGSFFVGKVGNAEQADPLRRELVAIYGLQMADRNQLKVRVLKGADGTGLEVAFAPSEGLIRDRERRDRTIRRLANHILGREEWKGLAFVEVHLALAGGEVHESRFERTATPPRSE
jgi:hypothetical protein